MTLEDVLQDLPSPLHLLLASQPPGADQSRKERTEMPSGPSLHIHWGFAALALQSCSSCASKTDTANNTGKKFCVLCNSSGQKGVSACKHVIKIFRCFNFALLYHLVDGKGNSITIISMISNCTFILESKTLILEIAQPTLCVDIWPHLHYKEIAQEDESLAWYSSCK